MPHIVVLKGTIALDMSTLGLEFTSVKSCQRQIDWQVKGGFSREDYRIMTRKEVKEIYFSHRLKNYVFILPAWNAFTAELHR